MPANPLTRLPKSTNIQAGRLEDAHGSHWRLQNLVKGDFVAEAIEQYKGPAENQYQIGQLSGLEWSPVKNAELNEEQKNAVLELYRDAAKRDYPARLVEVITAWEAALFYRGFQFLLPRRGGGWVIPGESTGYGPSMQMDLALLPTNIYSARSQMIIAALTRTVPTVVFAPQDPTNDADITMEESAEKFLQVIRRNNDFIMTQTDAARILWNDGRFGYWSRFVKDGQKFGWEEDDVPDDLVPEDEPAEEGTTPIEEAAGSETPEAADTAQEGPGDEGQEAQPEQEFEPQEDIEGQQPAEEESEEGEQEEKPIPIKERTPRGQEVRTAHGKLEMKIVPMMANDIDEVDVLMLDIEYDETRAKGMFPKIASKIKAGDLGLAEGEIAKLARQNVKLGMQSTYVTSSSVASDVTVGRAWFKTSYLMGIKDEKIREELIEMFPNGMLLCYAGKELAYARNESMYDCWALGHAYSGDGQNRNAMGTSTLPIQKRINNWLDLMNDFFVRAIPKKWMDNKTFNVQAIRGQSNIPGDIGAFKYRPGVSVDQLVFVEPAVVPPGELADFIKEYSGPLAELLSGAYPALAGGDTGTADSGVAIATQRDSALGRLAPTWHSIKKCESESCRQLIVWGAKCRDKSINEKIPGGEVVTIEINDLKSGNIACYPESDENFPVTYTQKKNDFKEVFDAATKSPQLGEVFFNGANLMFMKRMSGLKELYIPEVAAHEKQLGEITVLLKGQPVPNPQIPILTQKLQQLEQVGIDPMMLEQAKKELAALPLLVTSVPIDAEVDDNATEAATCWMKLNSEEGRKWKTTKPQGYMNLRLHFLDHQKAAAAKAAAAGQQGKPPSLSANYKDVVQVDPAAGAQMLQKGGLQPTPGSAPQPVPAGEGSKGPAAPLPTGATEHAGGLPKH